MTEHTPKQIALAERMQLPEGFIPHDGGECPVPLDSYPQVIFRDGATIYNHHTRAGEWIFPDSNLWQWTRHGPADIIAYKPEPTK